jgi:hypothetical protein
MGIVSEEIGRRSPLATALGGNKSWQWGEYFPADRIIDLNMRYTNDMCISTLTGS